MELVLFTILAAILAGAAQRLGFDSRDTVRESERAGSHAPLSL